MIMMMMVIVVATTYLAESFTFMSSLYSFHSSLI